MWLTAIVVLLGCLVYVNATCLFPEYLENSIEYGRSFWHYHTQPHFEEDTHLWYSGEHSTSTSYKWGKEQSHTVRICDEYIPNTDSYLVKISNNVTGTASISYACEQYTKRTANVITLRNSDEIKTRNRSLCKDENLHTHNWILTANYTVAIPTSNDAMECPIKGGYLFTSASGSPIKMNCKESPLTPLVQADCLPGDGLSLTFGDEACIPEGTHWSTDQQLVCLDKWHDSGFIYGILAENGYKPKYTYRMKVPTSNATDYVTELSIYYDIRAVPPKEKLPGDLRYVNLNLTQIDDKRECMDGVAICSTDTCHQDSYALRCPNSCATCLEMQHPDTCNFAEKYQGEWTQYTDTGSSKLNVTKNTVYLENFATFTCIEHFKEDYTVVRTAPTNNCSPQYACIYLHKITKSIMEYRLSQSSPIGDIPWSEMGEKLCDERRFITDPVHRRDEHRGRYSQVLIDDSSISKSSTRCLMDGGYMLYGYMKHNGTSYESCVGMVTEGDPDEDPDTMRLKLICHRGLDTDQLYYFVHGFKCVGHKNLTVDTRAILTMSLDNDTTFDFNCWVITTTSTNILVTILPSPQCDKESSADVISGQRPFVVEAYAVSKNDETYEEGASLDMPPTPVPHPSRHVHSIAVSTTPLPSSTTSQVPTKYSPKLTPSSSSVQPQSATILPLTQIATKHVDTNKTSTIITTTTHNIIPTPLPGTPTTSSAKPSLAPPVQTSSTQSSTEYASTESPVTTHGVIMSSAEQTQTDTEIETGSPTISSETDSTSSNQTDVANSQSEHASTGRVIGITFGCICGTIFTAIIIFVVWRVRSAKRQPYTRMTWQSRPERHVVDIEL